VPFVAKRGKNHDEYSKMTRDTWHENETSFMSESRNDDNEHNIVLRGIAGDVEKLILKTNTRKRIDHFF